MNLPMPIEKVSNLIAKCWSEAEESVRSQIFAKHWDVDEEFVTTLLRGELRDRIGNASRNREFENAFRADLESACSSDASDVKLDELAKDLHATVDFHRRDREGKTGGDLGLVLKWPNISDNGKGFKDVDNWLRTGKFDGTEDSSSIWKKLAKGSIGTDNATIIEELINPKDRDSLVITIDWPKNKRPDSEVQISVEPEQTVKIFLGQ